MILPHYVDVVRRTRAGADLSDVSLHGGQFHDVLIAPDRVYRFPRTATAAAELPDRAALLTALDELDLGVEVPTPLSDFDPSAPVGEGYLVLSRVHGTPLDRADATADAVIDVVAAEFTRVLRAMAATAPVDLVPTADPHRWAGFADGVRAELFPLMDTAGRERAERELAAVRELDHLATGLVHGDLGGENVLWQQIEELPRLVGIVDWDGAMVGDPAEDLAAVGASYGPDLLDRIIALLGVDRASTERRIEAYQGTFALQQALAGARDGDDEELEDGLDGYRRA
ncbi:aminoglycoside phosphotransferase (APT) family kinase protein [Saccharothrix tamanrassetensis]|uniref:Aminoglycoside phosphotransferase (APT) family kinase protein n=1 Tax=Saccharothrix tamanrassetensis TaxID=1051531 RepID=A0A841CNM6_9PSEU|nr:capreomycin phosphotransferase [Saccharothrix tamanrassetensis]MBB5957136.1 aminoglycoside phosphotransferase (APT) family kinase protein [Saccharothrix tamanrassetensis]